MTRKQFLATLASTRLISAQTAPSASVWAVHDEEKFEKDDLHNPSRPHNSAWDGRTVKLFAARNEVVAFQVIVEAGAAGLRNLRVALPELKQRGGRARPRLRAAGRRSVELRGPLDPDLYRKLPITSRRPERPAGSIVQGLPARPRNRPAGSRCSSCPRTRAPAAAAFRSRLPPAKINRLDRDLHSAHRPAGVYDGTLAVAADTAAKLPVALEVFDFALPDENSLDAMVYLRARPARAVPGPQPRPRLPPLRPPHRVELVDAYDEARVRARRAVSTAPTSPPQHGYEGPGEGVGNRIVPVSFYGPGASSSRTESAWKASDAWMGFLASTLPQGHDLPLPARRALPRAVPGGASHRGERAQSNPGPGGKLPTFVTKSIRPRARGRHRHLVRPAPGLRHRRPPRRSAPRGAASGSTTAGGRRGRRFLIDAPATDPRVVAGPLQARRGRLYFFWHGVHWQHNRQKQGERKQDVWANPITFDNRGQPTRPPSDQGYLNGDGVLLYPGEEKSAPGAGPRDRGAGRDRPAREPPARAAGPPVPDPRPQAGPRGRGARGLAASVVPSVFSDAGRPSGSPKMAKPTRPPA